MFGGGEMAFKEVLKSREKKFPANMYGKYFLDTRSGADFEESFLSYNSTECSKLFVPIFPVYPGQIAMQIISNKNEGEFSRLHLSNTIVLFSKIQKLKLSYTSTETSFCRETLQRQKLSTKAS